MGRDKSVKSGFRLAVRGIRQYQQRGIEKALFCLSHRDTVLFILPGVAVIPFEANDIREIDHLCILQ